MNSKNILLPFLVLGIVGSLVGIWYLNSAGPNLRVPVEELQKSGMLSTVEEEEVPMSTDAEQEQIPVAPKELKPTEIPNAAKILKTPQSSPSGTQIQNSLKEIQQLPPQERENALRKLKEGMTNRPLRNREQQ